MKTRKIAKLTKTTLLTSALALGTTIALTDMTPGSWANADDGKKTEKSEHKCGENGCGEKKASKKAADGACGAGSCGEKKDKGHKKGGDGSCGENTCGQ